MQRVIGVSRGWLYPGIVLAIACAMVASPWTYAEESAADASPEPAILAETDQTQPPVAPEPEPPVAPEPEQPPVAPETEQPPADPEPEVPAPPVLSDPTPTDEPLPVQTEEPQPTAEPTVEVTPTSEPSPTPEPTAEPTPVVTWSQTQPVKCELRDGLAAGLEYHQTRTYHCEVSAYVSSDIAMPDDMEIEWKLEVSFADSYQLRFPQGSQAQVIERIPSGTSTEYTIAHPWRAGSEQKLQFEIDVTRTTCAVGEQVLGIQAWPEIDTVASDAEIIRIGDSPNPATYTPEFLPNLTSPELSMTSVDFGSLEWDGYSWGTATGTSTITVTNNEPCATAIAHVVTLQVTSSDPALVPTLVTVAVGGNGLIAIDGEGEELLLIPAGFSGDASVELTFDLTPSAENQVGSYSFGFEVTVTAVP